MDVQAKRDIYTNPGDIEITMGQMADKSEYGVLISRGIGCNFIQITSSQKEGVHLADKAAGLKWVEDVLKEVLESVPEDSKGREGILSPQQVQHILEDLRVRGTASTYLWKLDVA